MQLPEVYSFVLSQIFGLFVFILGLVMLARATYYRTFFKNLKPNEPFIFFSAMVGLFLGIVLVDTHNFWVFRPAVYVTLICWFIFISSLCWLYMPERMLNVWKKILSSSGYYWIVGTMIVWGFVMLTAGFWSYLLGGGKFLLLRV